MSATPAGTSSASRRQVKSARRLSRPSRSAAPNIGVVTLLCTVLFFYMYMQVNDGTRPIKLTAPPHRSALKPKQPIRTLAVPARKAPPTPPIGGAPSPEEIDALSDICGQDTAKAYPPPWDKCKRGFVPHNVTLVSPPSGKGRVGDTIHYRIDSNVAPSRGCEPGGDFWHAVLSSDEGQPKASCTATIVDNCNGSYDMYALAAWPGNVSFQLTLVYRGDAVRHLRRVVWPAEGRLAFTATFTRGETNKTRAPPRSRCYFDSTGNWKGLCPYPHPKAMGNTTLVCRKIDGVPCDSLHRLKSYGSKIEGSAKRLATNVSYLFARPNRTQPLWIPSPSLEIKGGDYDPGKLPRCRPDQPVPRFQGYWRNGTWHSLLCAMTRNWMQRKPLRECLRNKHWVLLGDSTTRQWYLLLHKIIGIKTPVPPGYLYCCAMFRNFTSLNATLRFQIHPHVLGSYTVKITDVMFEVDALDSLVHPACNYVVVLSPWAHFTQWTKQSYVERTRLIREAVLRLRQRCPGVPVVLKGPHPRTNRAFSNHIHSSDYIIKQIEAINREMFRGIGVWFLPLWDINVAHPQPTNIHMPSSVIREELKMFLTYICES